MNENFLSHYNEELYFIRQMGAEFARHYPKVAAALDLDKSSNDLCPDPYIERLLEGFAFLSAGIKEKIQARFPVLNQHLLDVIYPHYLAPVPSMFIAQLEPDFNDPGLLEGVTVNKGVELKSVQESDYGTSLIYTTAHPVTLWPLNITQVDYGATAAELMQLGAPRLPAQAQSGIRLRLRATTGIALEQLTQLDDLTVYLQGEDRFCYWLYEQLFGHCCGYMIRPVGGANPWYEWRDAEALQHRGFADEDAILPYTPRSFSGYRLLQEYFALPQRLRFFRLTDLQAALRQCQGTEIDIILFFDRQEIQEFPQQLSAEAFQLHCTPVVNLFSKSIDPITLAEKKTEYPVIVERTRSMDFEVHSLIEVYGYAGRQRDRQPFYPLYHPAATTSEGSGFYTVKRQERRLSEQQQQQGARSHYRGNDWFITLADPQHPPYRYDLKQLHAQALCTNRDLSLVMTGHREGLRFHAPTVDAISRIHCLVEPTAPHRPRYYGERGWHLIHHLSLNYLTALASLEEEGKEAVATATATVKQLLQLYAGDHAVQSKKIQAIHELYTQAHHYRLPGPGPIVYVRGQELHLHCNEDAFVGESLFLFGQVLSEFFQRYTSIHSLTGLRLYSQQRGELMCWAPKAGQQMPY